MHSDFFESLGGTATCRAISTAFYSRVKQDPILRPLFPGKTLRCAIEEFAAFLVQFLGGPAEDMQFRWWVSLQESHRRFKIGTRERDAWMKNMVAALAEVPMDDSARQALRSFFEHSSAYVVNSGQAKAPAKPLDGELSHRWSAQRALDETVAAIHAGSAGRALELIKTSAFKTGAALINEMMRHPHPALLDFARQAIVADPVLVAERFNGRTLLHSAAATANLEFVELLIRLGADPNVTDGGGHTPLYSLANEYQGSGGGEVVRALVQRGAEVNACGGVKRCTPLHMAARRGSVEIAVALLDCGADPDSQDSLGVTPLRRAMNCRKPAIVSLLQQRR